MINYKEILKPFPLENKTLFGKVIKCKKINSLDGNELYYRVEITLTNKEMISFDENIYSNDGLLRSIIKFLNEPNESRRNQIMILSEGYNISNKLNRLLDDFTNFQTDNKKIKKELTEIYNKFRPYFYEFSATVKNLELGETLFKYHQENTFYEFTLSNSFENKKYNQNTIEGELLFSASPIEVENRTLIITDSRVDPIYLNKITNKKLFETSGNIIDISKKTLLNDVINEKIPMEINKIKYVMYNVGQGLCSYISLNRNCGIFFDVGFTKYKNDLNAILNKNSFKNRIPKIIILSHWDLDHILGVTYCNKEIFNRIWIAPDINELRSNDKSISALRLSKYLQLREALNNSNILRTSSGFKRYFIMIDDSFEGKTVYQNRNITLHKGYHNEKKVNGKSYSNYKNNYGLLLEIENKKNLLLTGDTDYYRMPKSIKTTKFDFLQVPHHGADSGEPKFSPPLKHYQSCTEKYGIALLSVSENFNSHGHPKYVEHIDILEKSGYKIHRTDKDGKCIINL